MRTLLDLSVADGYRSASQKARVITENWVTQNLYCPVCGKPRLNHYEANRPVSDFCCRRCQAEFELKSKRVKSANPNISRIADGAYSTMIERITSMNNPNLLYMLHNQQVISYLVLIPRFFFSPDIIEERAPLRSGARREGWVGCNINLRSVPDIGKIFIIRNGCAEDKNLVMAKYEKAKPLFNEDMDGRTWLMDVLLCVEKLGVEFSLPEVYGFEGMLSAKHPRNNNIQAKIRQQLQMLRDKGLLEFVGRGRYRKI